MGFLLCILEMYTTEPRACMCRISGTESYVGLPNCPMCPMALPERRVCPAGKEISPEAQLLSKQGGPWTQLDLEYISWCTSPP